MFQGDNKIPRTGFLRPAVRILRASGAEREVLEDSMALSGKDYEERST